MINMYRNVYHPNACNVLTIVFQSQSCSVIFRRCTGYQRRLKWIRKEEVQLFLSFCLAWNIFLYNFDIVWFFWQIAAEIEIQLWRHAPHQEAGNVNGSERRRGNGTETEIMTETGIEIGTETGTAIEALRKLRAALSDGGDARHLHLHPTRGAADALRNGRNLWIVSSNHSVFSFPKLS